MSVLDNLNKELKNVYNLLYYKQWEIAYENASEQRPYDVLLIKLYNASRDIFWQAELSYLPGLEADLPEFYIMQCFVPMVLQVPVQYNQVLSNLITKINTKLPLVGFGLLESHAAVYFKHNMLLPHHQPEANGKIIQETLSMMGYLLDNFQATFADVALGNKTENEAIETMPFSHIYK
jgi:hypothetical protein